MEDAAGFFANVFGGERFRDYVCCSTTSRYLLDIDCLSISIPQIGEISIMKDMTSVATTLMTDEEKAEVEKQLNPNAAAASSSSVEAKKIHPVNSATPTATTESKPKEEKVTEATQETNAPHATLDGSDAVVHSSASPSPPLPASTSISTSIKSAADKEHEKQELARRKAEQREKLREQELARRKVMEERKATLTKKMIERLRPLVEAKNPGSSDDPESIAFTEKMKREVEDLKLESFGVEVCRVEISADEDKITFRFVSYCIPLEAFIL